MSGHVERPPMTGERDAPFGAVAGSDGLTLDGYAAVFNRPTVIDSMEGRFREQTCPGSMAKSFRESKPKIQFEHGRSTIWGSLPIATLERAAEEPHPILAPEGGAHVVARMSPLPLFEPLRWAIAEGAVDGMSFRFSVLREAWHRHDGEPLPDREILRELERRYDGPEDELPMRSLKEVRVMELGPVVWPAYKETSVTMRSHPTVIDLGALRDNPEHRTLLFRALLGMAEQENTDDAPQPAAGQAVGEHPSDDAPQPAAEAVGEHPSTDAQPTTALRAAGGHPSKPKLTQRKPLKRGRRPVDIMVRTAREVSLRIAQENKNVS